MMKAVADVLIAAMVASSVPATGIKKEEQISGRPILESQIEAEEPIILEGQVGAEEPIIIEEPVKPEEPIIIEEPVVPIPIPEKPIVVEQPKPVYKKFDHDIASYITKYSGSETLNRNYNIRLASNSINGIILKPGDVFSFNNIILKKSHGGKDYKEAGVFVDGEVSSGMGGGFCQISSTLYQAALYSGMTITQRRNHSMQVGYLPPGRDATASWGSIDLQFKNQLKVPVMIESVMKNGTIKVRFLSQENPNIGDIKVTVTRKKDGGYLLSRIRNGKTVDYTAESYYRTPKKKK